MLVKLHLKFAANTESQQFPNDSLHPANIKLRDKYKPQTAPTLIKLTQAFHSMKLGHGKDPDSFFTDLECI
jgi:hypothetical protein